MAKRRRFTPEFKAQVVLEELIGVKLQVEICREHRLSRWSLYHEAAKPFGVPESKARPLSPPELVAHPAL